MLQLSIVKSGVMRRICTLRCRRVHAAPLGVTNGYRCRPHSVPRRARCSRFSRASFLALFALRSADQPRRRQRNSADAFSRIKYSRAYHRQRRWRGFGPGTQSNPRSSKPSRACRTKSIANGYRANRRKKTPCAGNNCRRLLPNANVLRRGATIYTSLEPCPMCATTILVCRVKRTVFLLQDTTFGGAWVSTKNQFYKKYNLTYGQLNLSDASSPFIMRVRDLHQTMSRRVEGIRNGKVIDTLIFDHLIEDLQTGFKLFCQVTPDDLTTRGDHNTTNRRTFDDLRRMCNVPTTRPASRAAVHFR